MHERFEKESLKDSCKCKVFVSDESNQLREFNRRFPSFLSPLPFLKESKCEAFHMEISFIHTQILVHLHVNKTNFHTKGFALGTRFETEAKENSEMA